MATTIAEAYVQILPSTEGIKNNLTSSLSADAESAASTAGTKSGSSFSSKFGKAVKIGATAITAATTATAALGKAAINAGTEYETAFAQVETIMDKNVVSTEDMSSAIKDLSNQMGISASELSGTVYNAISATGDTANAVELAAQASQLATAGFTDTGSALSVLTTAINAYGMSAEEATSISDSLIAVQNLGVTTVSELSSSMGKAIASASAYNVDLTNLESAYVSLTKGGINTAESTTYISSMLKELGSEGSTVSGILQEQTGKSFAELMDEGQSLGDVLGILSDSVDGDATALMNLWSSAEAGKASNAIVSQGLEEFNTNLNTIADSAGLTQSAYDTMADTLEHKTEVFKTLGTNLLSTVYEGMSGELGDFVTLGNEALQSLSDGFTEGGIDGLMSALGDVLSTLVNQVVLKLPDMVTAGTELLMSLATGIISNLPTIAESAISIIENLASSLTSNISTLIPTVVSIVLEVANTLISNLPTIISAGLELFQGIVSGLIAAIPIIIEQLPVLIDSTISALLESIPLILEAGTELFLALVDAIPMILDSLESAIPQIIDTIVSFLTGDGLPSILNAAITMLMSIVEAIPTIVSSLASSLPTIVVSIVSALVSAAPQILSSAITLFSNLVSGLSEVAGTLVSEIPTICSDIISSFTSGLAGIVDIGKNLIAGLWNGISDKAEWVYGKITSLGSTVLDKVKSIFGVSSPSKEFAKIGGYLAEGLGIGWEDNIGEVEKSINKTLTFKGSVENGNNYTPADNKTTFTLNETVELGGTKLKDIVSTYTIEKIGNETKAVRLATGGAY